MNILYLAHRIPFPPDKGDKIRSFHQVNHLAARHRVWCACFVDDPADMQYAAALDGLCEAAALLPMGRTRSLARGITDMAMGGTITTGFYHDARMRSVLRQWNAKVRFDAVLAFSSSMAPYGLSCPAGRRVVDFCDLDSAKWAAYARQAAPPLRWLYATEARRLADLERRWAAEYDAAVVITDAEAALIPDDILRKSLSIVRNGVSVRDHATPDESRRVGFIGDMSYPPNIDAVRWFAKDAWPRVRAAMPEAEFHVIGRRPTAQVQALARQPGIRVIGAVPEIGPYIDAMAVHVAPLRIARGLQNKVLEAMAAGRAVVLTSDAACGIDAEPGRHYVVADEAASMAGAVVDLLQNPQQARRIGDAARRLMIDEWNWSSQMDRLERLLTVSMSCTDSPNNAHARTKSTPLPATIDMRTVATGSTL